jgi:hypothetical protein
MAYEGDFLNHCPAKPFDFRDTSAVVVSGSGPNFCGHMLLNVGGYAGKYFHAAGGVYHRPLMMDAFGYARYLKENNKKELNRQRIHIPKPLAAQAKLEEIMIKKRAWLVLPNNCADFVEDIIRAGGSNKGLYLNCPTLEPMQAPITDQVKSKTEQVKSQLLQMDIAGKGVVKLFPGGMR